MSKKIYAFIIALLMGIGTGAVVYGSSIIISGFMLDDICKSDECLKELHDYTNNQLYYAHYIFALIGGSAVFSYFFYVLYKVIK